MEDYSPSPSPSPPIEEETKEGVQPTKFNWGEFIRKFAVSAGLIALVLTIIGGLFTYALHVSEQIGDLKEKQGNLEGKMEILIQDRQNQQINIPIVSPKINSTPTPTP